MAGPVKPGGRAMPGGPRVISGARRQPLGGPMRPAPGGTNLGPSRPGGPTMGIGGPLNPAGNTKPPGRDLSQGGSMWTLPGQMGRNPAPGGGQWTLPGQMGRNLGTSRPGGPMMNTQGWLGGGMQRPGMGQNLGMSRPGGPMMNIGMPQGQNLGRPQMGGPMMSTQGMMGMQQDPQQQMAMMRRLMQMYQGGGY